ncbi:hypothetical protein HYH02_013522 [Chlamydomonas schloesseri]|uniref:Uncharacterized protein n=1 Tax=Chlamydomonas schloesseri TaxID=2026947 RepID=A0A835VX02_9CHLO|nr:hypothetical protein HYH02_013522 [Chlamydomonas schloesseri]|eukprot:KAG2430990.1 hypothetical protein HYH02_013522 [Chlamydomonas schloesseri]
MAPSKPAAKQRKATSGQATADTRSHGTAAASTRAAGDPGPTSAGRNPADVPHEAAGRRPKTFTTWAKVQLYRLHVALGGPIWTSGENVLLYLLLVAVVGLIGLGAYKQLSKLAELMAAGAGGGSGLGGGAAAGGAGSGK